MTLGEFRERIAGLPDWMPVKVAGDREHDPHGIREAGGEFVIEADISDLGDMLDEMEYAGPEFGDTVDFTDQDGTVRTLIFAGGNWTIPEDANWRVEE